MLALLKYILLKIWSLWNIYSWKFVLYGMNTVWLSYHIPLNYVWTLSLCFCYCQKNLESKVLVVMEVFQSNCFLSCDLLINITYFYAKIQDNFFLYIFLQFRAFLLMFVTILAWDHMEIWSYFKYAYFKEHISAFERILSFGHWIILPQKHCICRKNLNFGQLYL